MRTSNITDQVEPLLDVMHTLQCRYEELLTLLVREKQAAFHSDADLLNSVIVHKQELTAGLRRLERQRNGLIQQIAARLQIPASSLSLSSLAGYADDPQATRIRHLRDSLSRLLPHIQRVNEENRVLIQHCLGLVQGTLGFFQRWLTPASIYGNQGRIGNGSVMGRLLSGMV